MIKKIISSSLYLMLILWNAMAQDIKIYNCPFDHKDKPESFNTLIQFNKHLKEVHINQSKYDCPFDHKDKPESFNTLRQFNHHLREVHLNQLKKEQLKQTIEITKDGMKMLQMSGMFHIGEHKFKSTYFTCFYCSEADRSRNCYADSRSLSAHIVKSHNNNPEIASKNMLKCMYCLKDFSYQKQLHQHIRSSHYDKTENQKITRLDDSCMMRINGSIFMKPSDLSVTYYKCGYRNCTWQSIKLNESLKHANESRKYATKKHKNDVVAEIVNCVKCRQEFKDSEIDSHQLNCTRRASYRTLLLDNEKPNNIEIIPGIK